MSARTPGKGRPTPKQVPIRKDKATNDPLFNRMAGRRRRKAVLGRRANVARMRSGK